MHALPNNAPRTSSNSHTPKDLLADTRRPLILVLIQERHWRKHKQARIRRKRINLLPPALHKIDKNFPFLFEELISIEKENNLYKQT